MPNNVIRPSFTRQSYIAQNGGNAVRQEEVSLDTYRLEQLERQEERRRRWEKQIHKRAVQREFEERRAKSNICNLQEAVVIATLVTVLFLSCVFYLSQMSIESRSLRQANNLKKQYVQLVEDNNAINSHIEGSIDYDQIYNYAVSKLGMNYPEKGQVVNYSKRAPQYVKQGEKIPE